MGRFLGSVLFCLCTPALMEPIMTSSASETPEHPPTSRTLLSGGDFRPELWRIVDDVVMGGISRSRITTPSEATGLFAGELSLENNGGFASARTMLDPTIDLSAFSGLEVRVKGDGKIFQLRLRTDREFDGIAYRARFTTERGSWVTIRVPFSAFEPTFRGRTLHQ